MSRQVADPACSLPAGLERELVTAILQEVGCEGTAPATVSPLCLARLRCLRNAVAARPPVQTAVWGQLVGQGLDPPALLTRLSDYPTALRASTQLLCNLCVGQPAHCHAPLLLPSVTRLLDTVQDAATRDCAGVLLLTILANTKDPGPELAALLPLLARQPGPQPDSVELFLLQAAAQPLLLERLEPWDRLTALPWLPRPPPPATVRLLCSDFCQLTDSQLLTTGRAVETDSAGTRDLVRLTRLLAKCSDQAGELQAVMQESRSLLLNTVYTLRLLQEAGRVQPELSVLGKLRDDTAQLTDCPVLGWKSDLVQLLTGLVWEHGGNKDLAGQQETLPLLLDLTRMDARNPLVTQRAVVALRALTASHPANQALLAGLASQGTRLSDLYNELGL